MNTLILPSRPPYGSLPGAACPNPRQEEPRQPRDLPQHHMIPANSSPAHENKHETHEVFLEGGRGDGHRVYTYDGSQLGRRHWRGNEECLALNFVLLVKIFIMVPAAI